MEIKIREGIDHRCSPYSIKMIVMPKIEHDDTFWVFIGVLT